MFDFKMNYFVLVTFLCGVYVSGKVPSYIKICSRNENLKQCLTDNFKNVLENIGRSGDPSLHLQPLSKIHVENLLQQGGNNLQLILKNVDFCGLEQAELDDISIDDKELELNMHVPVVETVGSYKMKGKLFIMPLEGDGELNITFVGITFNYKAKLKTEERNKKFYFYVDNNLNDTQLGITLSDTYITFGNLFGGDPKLGSEMNVFMNENWKDVYGVFEIAVKKTVAFALVNPVINAYLRRIPIDRLFS